MLLHICRD